ncbi:MAG TPA: hypothetical protein VFY14_02555 [Streptomyces sp.]|nr:hypothetical protein [Streptomyces sp.]
MTEDTPEPVERNTADGGQQESSRTGGRQGEQDADRARRSRLGRRRGAVAAVVALATAVAVPW